MPCRYEEGPADFLRTEKEKNSKMKKDLDDLTAENDRLRDAVLTLIKDRDAELHPDVVKAIEQDQTEHRRADLARLHSTFVKNAKAASRTPEARAIWLERLGAVIIADPTKPLEPQLGFDADDF